MECNYKFRLNKIAARPAHHQPDPGEPGWARPSDRHPCGIPRRSAGRPHRAGRGAGKAAGRGSAADPASFLWGQDPERNGKAPAYHTGADLPAGTQAAQAHAGKIAGRVRKLDFLEKSWKKLLLFVRGCDKIHYCQADVWQTNLSKKRMKKYEARWVLPRISKTSEKSAWHSKPNLVKYLSCQPPRLRDTGPWKLNNIEKLVTEPIFVLEKHGKQFQTK